MNKLLLKSLTLPILLLLTLSGFYVFGHDSIVVPHPATSNYQHFMIFTHFAIGISGNINYTCTLQITNKDRERRIKARLTMFVTDLLALKQTTQ